MEICLCLKSALELYHAARIVDDPDEQSDPYARRKPLGLTRSHATLPPAALPDGEALSLLLRQFGTFTTCGGDGKRNAVDGITAPIHLLAGRTASRWAVPSRRVFYTTGPLLDQSLVRIEQDLYLSSPEHLVLQAATRLDTVTLAWFASELCAVYSVHPALGGQFLPARPLTTIERLRMYLENAAVSGMHGARKALGALPLTLERAASPRELASIFFMVPPMSMGGRGVPKPLLNHRIEIDRRIASIHGWDSFCVDACWPENKLVLEYNSDTHHLDPKRQARDNDKQAALEDMGWHVIPFSTKQFDDIQLASDTFKRVANYLGVHKRAASCHYDWQARRSKLYMQIWRLLEQGASAKLVEAVEDDPGKQ